MNLGFEVALLRDTTATTTLVLRGELDLAAAGAAQEAVEMALDDRARAYVLDLSDLHHLSAAGTTPLVRLTLGARQMGARVTARRAGTLVALLLRLTPIELDDAPLSLGRSLDRRPARAPAA